MLQLLPPAFSSAEGAPLCRDEFSHVGDLGIWSAFRTRPVRVLLLGGDRIYADALRSLVHESLPGAFVRDGVTFGEAERILAEGAVDLVLTGALLPDGDLLELLVLGEAEATFRPRVLVITARRDRRFLFALSEMGLVGVFDPSVDGFMELTRAIRCLAGGGMYWSASVLDRLTRWQKEKRPLTRVPKWNRSPLEGGRTDDSVADTML